MNSALIKDPLKLACLTAILLLVSVLLLAIIQRFVSPPVTTTPDSIIVSSSPVTPTDYATPTTTLDPPSTSTPRGIDFTSTPITITLTPTSTQTSTDTPTLTVTPTYTITPATYTPSPFPDPNVGPIVTNGPPLFSVEGWDGRNTSCGNDVIIYGVTISHGTQPYTFTFWTQNEPYIAYRPVIQQVVSLRNSRDYVIFTPPIVIVKGKHKHVEFSFQDKNQQEVKWIDDLFYLSPGEECNH